MSRQIFLVRHGQRLDNVDKTWKTRNPTKYDDPNLTARGKLQAQEVGRTFATANIERLIVSPYTRCIETSIGITSMMEKPPKICVEPGFMEPLHAAMDPPGYPTMAQIKELTPLIDDEYEPVFEKVENEAKGDLGCAARIIKTLQEDSRKYPDANLIIVTHGTPIANVHAYLAGTWVYPGQCTISTIRAVQGEVWRFEKYNSKDHLSDPTGLHENVKAPRK